MVGRTTPRRAEYEVPFWGTVRGVDIHWACATEEELGLTWMRFASQEQAPDKDCRCGRPLSETPDP